MLLLKTFGIAMLITTFGFYKFIYFISLCYGFSIFGIGAFLLIKTNTNLTFIELILCILYMVYGLRLALFLAIREWKSKAYKEKLDKELSKSQQIKMFYKILIWISCSLLYVCQTCPLTFRILSKNKNDYLVFIGIIIMLFGLILEIKADNEKDASKKINPSRFVDTGLYKYVRCPNYLGEVIFWTGNFIGGLKIYEGGFQWLFALLGYTLIIYVMFSGARRIEIRQNKNYGKDPIFQKYIKNTPIMIPFIPLYSVEKYTWLKG